MKACRWSGRGGSVQNGFTIVETLIVLAVTGGLLTMAMFFIGGRQNRVQFMHAVRDAQSKIQSVMNEVSVGYYPHSKDHQCRLNGADVVIVSAGSSEQGTNIGCVNLGKVVHMAVASPEATEFNIYNIAGRQGSIASPIADLTASHAKVARIGSGACANDSCVPNGMIDRQKLLNGLSVAWMRYGSTPVGTIGFIINPGTLSGGDSSENVSVVAFPGTDRGQTVQTAVNAVEASLSTGTYQINPAGGVRICLKSGSTQNQSALLKVGGSKSNGVEVKTYSNETCA